MTLDNIVEHIRSIHSQCCLTTKSGERNCSLNIRGFDSSSLVMLDGTRYQRAHSYRERLCDHIVFGRWQGTNFVSAVELKGGRNLDVSEALEQIQNGLNVASSLLEERQVSDWYPLLMFSGHLGAAGREKIRLKPVQFGRDTRAVTRRDCGSLLSDIL